MPVTHDSPACFTISASIAESAINFDLSNGSAPEEGGKSRMGGEGRGGEGREGAKRGRNGRERILEVQEGQPVYLLSAVFFFHTLSILVHPSIAVP